MRDRHGWTVAFLAVLLASSVSALAQPAGPGNCFTIRTSAPGVEVSWLVTGVRHDPYAEAHRIPVEERKPDDRRGRYLHPEAWGQARDRAEDWERLQELRRPLGPVPPVGQ